MVSKPSSGITVREDRLARRPVVGDGLVEDGF
jgi:hypothetical protein